MIGKIVFFVYDSINSNLTKEEIEFYIKCADDASAGKKQVNWKYLAAIDNIINKNYSLDSQEVQRIANLFLEEDLKTGTYTLKNMDYVLGCIGVDDLKQKKVYKYLEKIKFEGIKSSRLKENSKYMIFINSIKESALENYKEYKILPSITIAQAILESNWGESELSTDGNNLFGIKADSSWKGEIVNMQTLENYDTKVEAKFRKYQSTEESIKDHAKFVYENKRYKDNGVFDATYYKEQAKSLENAGYSTKEDESGKKVYADLLVQIIQTYNLQLIDSDIQTEIQTK